MIAKRITPVPTMRRSLRRLAAPAVVALLLTAGWLLVCPAAQPPLAAQASALDDGPPPPPPDDPPAQPAKSILKRGASDAPQPSAPSWDPLHAKRSVDVGIFYLKKGDYDAAIDRFQEAARLQAGFAKPYLLLGEAYEKKNDTANAVASYRKYLGLYQDAPDREKILKRIEKLQTQTAHE